MAARRAELEQIIQDVEYRRLSGFFRDDLDQIRNAFANLGYFESTMAGLPDDFALPEEPSVPSVKIDQLLFDSSTCISVQVTINWGPQFTESGTSFRVYETRRDGSIGLSFIGTGYGCMTEHPFGDEKL